MRFCIIILILSLFNDKIKTQQTRLMDSLKCFNDYQSYIKCTWSEHRNAREFVKMELLYSDDEGKLTEMTCSSQDEESEMITWNCYKNHTIFVVRGTDTFIFTPESKLELKQNISLFNRVQLFPPQNLSVSVTEEGDYLLVWEAGDETNRTHWLNGTLDVEVTYKRVWEPWEDAATLVVSQTSHCLLQHKDLLPGSSYVARVRKKPRQDGGLASYYSKWSNLVNWTTQKTWTDNEEGQPKNLHCVYNGIDQLKCSWEVRQEVQNSVSFALFYKASAEAKEEMCSPTNEVSLAPYVLQNCEFTVPDPEAITHYFMTVRPKEEKKVFKTAKNIKPEPPYDLSVTARNNWEYRLQWEVENEIIKQKKIYQISYWKTGNSSEAKYSNTSSTSFIFPLQFLEPATNYTVKVRAIVNDSVSYSGPWGDWSEEINWSTAWYFPPWVILVITSISILLMMAGICSCHKYLLRRKKTWEKNIPRPPKTFLLPDFFKKVQLSSGLKSSNQTPLQEETNGYSTILEREMLVNHLEHFQLGEMKPSSIVIQNAEDLNISIADVCQHLSQIAENDRPIWHHSTQAFDYNGPYLGLPPETSHSEVLQDSDIVPLEPEQTPVPLQYVGLPHCSSLKQPPMGKEKEIAPRVSGVLVKMEEKVFESQEAPQSQSTSSKLEKVEKEAQNLHSFVNTHNVHQTVALDYIDTKDVSQNKQGGSLPLFNVVPSMEGKLKCANMAKTDLQLAQTTGDPSSQEKQDSIQSVKDQAQPSPSLTFGDYTITFPHPSGFVQKEEHPCSMEEHKHEESFLVFNPGNCSPVLLCQVNEYCFFPGSRHIKESLKDQEQHHEKAKNKIDNKAQCSLHCYQDSRATVPQ